MLGIPQPEKVQTASEGTPARLSGFRDREAQLTILLSLVIGVSVGLVVVAFILLTGRLAARLYPGRSLARLASGLVGIRPQLRVMGKRPALAAKPGPSETTLSDVLTAEGTADSDERRPREIIRAVSG